MKTQSHPSRIRVSRGDRTFVDTREALVAYETGGSSFYLLPESAVDAELRDDPDRPDHVLVVVDGEVLTTRGRRYADQPGFVQLDPVNLFDVRARWAPGELTWTEEGQPTTAHARNPHHRVDVRRLDGAVKVSFEGAPLLETPDARLVLEAPLPMRVYVAATAFPAGSVTPSADAPTTWCPYKGLATYFDLKIGGTTLPRALWAYNEGPLNHLLPDLQGYLGFVADERLTYDLS
ncbi:MAG: DUF427 domain-containing protein [Myxococcota bacterium]